jgi:hypothetical protein
VANCERAKISLSLDEATGKKVLHVVSRLIHMISRDLCADY